jgi:hypothetical protein
MGRASSSKKVARAASTGGGRTSRGRTPWLWYSVMTLVVILGVFGVALSRSDLSQAAADPPAIGKDHWHAAYGISICGKFHAGLTDTQGDRYGIHSHGDGLVHIHPTSSASAGKNARLGVFMKEEGVKLTANSLEMPEGTKHVSGQTKCGSKPGKLQVGVWETPDDPTVQMITGDPNQIRLKQAEVITIAFLADGEKMKKPPSANQVHAPSDVQSDLGKQTPTTVAPSEGSTTVPSSTTAPPAGGGPSSSTP